MRAGSVFGFVILLKKMRLLIIRSAVAEYLILALMTAEKTEKEFISEPLRSNWATAEILQKIETSLTLIGFTTIRLISKATTVLILKNLLGEMWLSITSEADKKIWSPAEWTLAVIKTSFAITK